MEQLVDIFNLANARRVAPGDYDALISIGSNGTRHSAIAVPFSLFLTVGGATPFLRVHQSLPTGEHIKSIIDFAREMPNGCRFITHCFGGRSRSPAAAIIICASRGMGTAESVNLVLCKSKLYKPNGWMLALADILLGTELFPECKSRKQIRWK